MHWLLWGSYDPYNHGRAFFPLPTSSCLFNYLLIFYQHLKALDWLDIQPQKWKFPPKSYRLYLPFDNCADLKKIYWSQQHVIAIEIRITSTIWDMMLHNHLNLQCKPHSFIPEFPIMYPSCFTDRLIFWICPTVIAIWLFIISTDVSLQMYQYIILCLINKFNILAVVAPYIFGVLPVKPRVTFSKLTNSVPFLLFSQHTHTFWLNYFSISYKHLSISNETGAKQSF